MFAWAGSFYFSLDVGSFFFFGWFPARSFCSDRTCINDPFTKNQEEMIDVIGTVMGRIILYTFRADNPCKVLSSTFLIWLSISRFWCCRAIKPHGQEKLLPSLAAKSVDWSDLCKRKTSFTWNSLEIMVWQPQKTSAKNTSNPQKKHTPHQPHHKKSKHKITKHSGTSHPLSGKPSTSKLWAWHTNLLHRRGLGHWVQRAPRTCQTWCGWLVNHWFPSIRTKIEP